MLCKLLDIKTVSEKPIMIDHIKTSVLDIDHNTVIFNLHKTHTLNIRRLENFENCYIITDQPILKSYRHLKHRFLFVFDIEKAYDKFIDYYRSLYNNIKTVAITGTCGKTTTKEMIKQVLEKKYQTTGTILSKNSLRFNLDYLLDIDESKQFGVYETALTDPGQIIYSAKFFKPSVGVITNIGIDHLSGCKTMDNYILAKGEMLAALENKGTLIINSDDANIKKIDFSSFRGKILGFGIKHKTDYYASDIKYQDDMIHFNLNHKNKQYEVKVPGIGEHNVYNALAALAVLDVLGMDLSLAVKYLASYKHIRAHLEKLEGLNGSTIIDDTWSSNPTSLHAAFSALKDTKVTKVAVLGNISYLGDFVLEQCKNIAKMVVDYKIDYLVTIDAFSNRIGEEAIKLGMERNKVLHCKNEEELKQVLTELLRPNVLVLFKTSMFDRKIKTIIKQFIKEGKDQ